MTIDALLSAKGTSVVIHTESDSVACPCLTPEGYRDPIWHKANPSAPECNDAGYLFSGTDLTTTAFVLPASSGGSISYLTQLFGEIRTDDHVGIFPVSIGYDFKTLILLGENYIVFNGDRYMIVGANLIPDPAGTSTFHHWELGLRKLNPQVQDGETIF